MELAHKLHDVEECLLSMRVIAAFLANDKLRAERYSALGRSVEAVLDCLQREQKAGVGSEKEMWATAHLKLTRCQDTITDILEKGPESITWDDRNFRITGPTEFETQEFAKVLKKLNRQIDGSLRFIFDILNTRQAAEGD
jgi:hypothetical protein